MIDEKAKISTRQGARQSRPDHLAGICNAVSVRRHFSAFFFSDSAVQRFSDSGH